MCGLGGASVLRLCCHGSVLRSLGLPIWHGRGCGGIAAGGRLLGGDLPLPYSARSESVRAWNRHDLKGHIFSGRQAAFAFGLARAPNASVGHPTFRQHLYMARNTSLASRSAATKSTPDPLPWPLHWAWGSPRAAPEARSLPLPLSFPVHSAQTLQDAPNKVLG